MKTISKLMMLITLLAVVACNSNDASDLPAPQEEYGTVEFSYDIKENTENNGGRKGTAGRTENVTPVEIVISIKNAADELVEDGLVMPLISVGGAYITNQLTLLAGTYQITEYFVKDGDGNTIYVTPQEGSPLDHLVNDPLPIDFTVSKDVNSQESPEVVSPDGFTPEDFGYPSFRLNIVNTIDFLASVHILDVQTATYELTDSRVQIFGDGDEIYDSLRVAATNQIRIRDGFINYRILISKPGYLPYDQTFDQAGLESFQASPLYVLLGPDVINYTVQANDNSTTGGTGVDAGSYLDGEQIRLWADPNDTWDMFPNDLTSNADGLPDDVHGFSYGGITVGVGTLVGSWDNGTTVFEIGVFEEISAPVGGGSLTLWCFDSDKDNNSGSVEVSVQKY